MDDFKRDGGGPGNTTGGAQGTSGGNDSTGAAPSGSKKRKKRNPTMKARLKQVRSKLTRTIALIVEADDVLKDIEFNVDSIENLKKTLKDM